MDKYLEFKKYVSLSNEEFFLVEKEIISDILGKRSANVQNKYSAIFQEPLKSFYTTITNFLINTEIGFIQKEGLLEINQLLSLIAEPVESKINLSELTMVNRLYLLSIMRLNEIINVKNNNELESIFFIKDIDKQVLKNFDKKYINLYDEKHKWIFNFLGADVHPASIFMRNNSIKESRFRDSLFLKITFILLNNSINNLFYIIKEIKMTNKNKAKLIMFFDLFIRIIAFRSSGDLNE